MEQVDKKFAGFWWRFLAIIIDGLILGVVKWIVITPILATLGFGAFKAATSGEMDEVAAIGMVGAFAGAMAMVWIFTIIAGWLYFSLMESSKFQGTIGKLALGIIVTDMEGNKISFGKATGRYFGKIISGIILYVGFMMAGFTEKKQGLHDILAGTLVWKK
ncbi:MAG TPA: RDD family protein [Bacteroidales bacterium]|nr:RDD family protein [Bacteroidales bacterium]